MHVPEFSALGWSCYRICCWPSTWIHGNSIQPFWLFSKASFTPMIDIFTFAHLSLIYWVFFFQKLSPKRFMSIMCICRTLLPKYLPCCLDVISRKKDLLLQLRSLKSLMTDIKPSDRSLRSRFSSGLMKMFFMNISHPSNCLSLFPCLPLSSHQKNVCYPLK